MKPARIISTRLNTLLRRHPTLRISCVVIAFLLCLEILQQCGISFWYSPIAAPDEFPSYNSGGVPGFTVFDNVWFHNDTFYLFALSEEGLPDIDQIRTESTGLKYRIETPATISADPQLISSASKAKRLPGTSVFLNDQGYWSLLQWYYHFFAELILGSFAVLSSVPELPYRGNGLPAERIIFGREKVWNDRYRMNEVILRGIFGTESIIESETWAERTQRDGEAVWLFFDRVIIVDRWTVHRHSKLVADADIIIGVHGNGLTHEIWMPEGGTVYELFPPGGLLRQYKVVSALVGHTHHIVRTDRVIPKSEWENHPEWVNPVPEHDGTETQLDKEFIMNLLLEEVERMSRARG